MTIRQATLIDVKRISALMAELDYDVSENVIKDKLGEISTSDIDKVFVADVDGKVMGFISCHLTQLFHETGRAGRITSVAVSSDARGKGIGKKLIEKADQYFQKNGCSKAEVTSGDHRPEAHKFYKANGYQVDERRFIKYFEE